MNLHFPSKEALAQVLRPDVAEPQGGAHHAATGGVVGGQVETWQKSWRKGRKMVGK